MFVCVCSLVIILNFLHLVVGTGFSRLSGRVG